MTWLVECVKRTPSGIYIELESRDGRGWLKYYSDEPLDFDSDYRLTLTELTPDGELADEVDV